MPELSGTKVQWPYTVVGVLPAALRLPLDYANRAVTQLWVPLQIDPAPAQIPAPDAVKRALDVLKMQPDKCTAVIQGFGNVGGVAARIAAAKAIRVAPLEMKVTTVAGKTFTHAARRSSTMVSATR